MGTSGQAAGQRLRALTRHSRRQLALFGASLAAVLLLSEGIAMREAAGQMFWETRRPAEPPDRRGRTERPATPPQQLMNPFQFLWGGGTQQPAQPAQEAPPRAAQPTATAGNRAPPPRRGERRAGRNVLVLGDSMAEWLAHGLEVSYDELESAANDLGVARRGRHGSSLIRNTPREFDWAQHARELLAKEQPDFIVMMIGLGDRGAIREVPPPVPQPRPAQAEAGEAEEPARPQRQAAMRRQRPVSHEFRSERWIELYTQRIDQVISVLRASGAPVLWVGLPPVQPVRAQSDVTFLNGLFKARADAAGIMFVDIWDLFLGEDGNYAATGPDVMGQNRQLRSPDGLHFTAAGARKLAHFVDREIKRLLMRHTPLAQPMPDGGIAAPRSTGTRQRPSVGPVISLNGGTPMNERMLGASPYDDHVADPIVLRVLVKGEAPPPRPGRADHFTWPPPHMVAENTILTPATAVATDAPAPDAAAQPEARGDPASPAVARAAARPAGTVQ